MSTCCEDYRQDLRDMDAKLRDMRFIIAQMRELLAAIQHEKCFSCDCGIPDEVFDRIDAILGNA